MNIKEKVLLIEDERTIRGFMQAILTANGYDVLMAGTGAMADTMISSHCPDIIILDLGLPDMDGMTILRNVRKWSKVPILVVSARSYERDKVEALDAGADEVVLPRFPYAGYLHGATPVGEEKLMYFKEFYGIPQDVDVLFD